MNYEDCVYESGPLCDENGVPLENEEEVINWFNTDFDDVFSETVVEEEPLPQQPKRGRGRPRKDRMNELKSFVEKLLATFPDASTYKREDLQMVGDENLVGMTMFTSDKAGYGLQTRIGRGLYAVPKEWSVAAPWMT